jgi:uncharacterized protein YaiL (DUF2058 family)
MRGEKEKKNEIKKLKNNRGNDLQAFSYFRFFYYARKKKIYVCKEIEKE